MEKARKTGVFGIPVLGAFLRLITDAVVYGGEKIRKSLVRHNVAVLSEERISSGKRRSVPVGAIMLAVVFTILLMVIVYSFSQVYETRSQIGDLQAQQTALKKEADELSLRLELRDDILTIQKVATEELGMVNASEVESRYVAVSGGERVEVAETENRTGGEGLWSFLGNLKYYFH